MVCAAVGAKPAAKIMWLKISKVGKAKMHYSELMVGPSVAKAVKSTSK
jgi:hypothetical protein